MRRVQLDALWCIMIILSSLLRKNQFLFNFRESRQFNLNIITPHPFGKSYHFGWCIIIVATVKEK